MSMMTYLNYKQLETHWCVISTVATDGLVLKHQAISIHNADHIAITLDQFQTEWSHLLWTISENKKYYIYYVQHKKIKQNWYKNISSCLWVQLKKESGTKTGLYNYRNMMMSQTF